MRRVLRSCQRLATRRFTTSGGQLRPLSSIQQKKVDHQLKQVFDNESYWKNISGTSSGLFEALDSRFNPFADKDGVGLFRNPYLTSVHGLQQFADVMLQRANEIVSKLETDTSDKALLEYIKSLDTLSDTICKVIDLCEFLRVTHPDPKYIDAAQECHEKMFNYMNLLNTNVRLHEILDAILYSPKLEHIRQQLRPDQIEVGKQLHIDFCKSGIDKDAETQQLFVEVSSKIAQFGQYFATKDFEYGSKNIQLKKRLLKDSLPGDIYTQIISEIGTISTKGSSIGFPTNSHISQMLIRHCSNELVRRTIWTCLNTSNNLNYLLLEHMLNYRKILAMTMNYENFNDYQLEDKMAKNSDNVLVFLKNLQEKIKPYCVEELRRLVEIKIDDYASNENLVDVEYHSAKIADLPAKLKKRQLSDSEVIRFVKPWDREYLVGKYLLNKRRRELVKSGANLSQPISSFFSLGTVLANLSKLLSSIYGVRFMLDRPGKGEIWHPDVRKVLVVNADDEKDIVGIMYLDLFERLGKSPNPAHFTIVCSRKVSDAREQQNCVVLNDDVGPPKDNGLNKDVKYIQCVKTNNSLYQLPIITLSCNFAKSTKLVNGTYQSLALLSLADVETLFHEMGHSLHSMFGKTDLHTVSGTRCTADFVELPSILMETFSRDSRVLQFLGEHYEFGENPETEEFKAALIELHLRENGVLKYCDVYSQLKLSYLDQMLHLKTPWPKYVDETGQERELRLENVGKVNINNLDALAQSNLHFSPQIYHAVEREMEIFSDEESHWFARFGHLYSYGATYYTYLFDRVISSKVYKELFLEDPFSRKRGLVFKNSVLRWGGSRPAWECLSECLNDKRLTEGGSKGMELLGEVDEVK